jgi:hypothetical protein
MSDRNIVFSSLWIKVSQSIRGRRWLLLWRSCFQIITLGFYFIIYRCIIVSKVDQDLYFIWVYLFSFLIAFKSLCCLVEQYISIAQVIVNIKCDWLWLKRFQIASQSFFILIVCEELISCNEVSLIGSLGVSRFDHLLMFNIII